MTWTTWLWIGLLVLAAWWMGWSLCAVSARADREIEKLLRLKERR